MPDLPNGLERLLPGDITWREVINDNLARLDRAWIDAGLASERPDSAATGHARFWYAKDTNVLSWDTGSGWIDVVGGDVDLTSDVTGILPVENGGTGLSSIAANNILYTSANDTLEAAAITAFGRSLIDDADASTARGTLGLGTLAVENAASIGVNLIPDGSRNLGGVANPWLEGFFSSSVNTQVGNDFTSGTGRFEIIRGGNSHALCWDKDRQNFFLGTDGAGSTNGVLAVLGLRTRTTLAGGDIGESAYRFGTAFLNDIDLPGTGTIEIGDVELSRAGTGRLGVDSLLTGDGTTGAPAVSIGVTGTGLSRSGTNVSMSIGGANRYRWENNTAYYGFNTPNLGQSANRWGTGFLNNIDLPNAGKIDIGDVELSRAAAGVLVLDGERLRAPRLESEIVMEMRRFGNRPRLSMFRANGTRESPTNVTSGQTISSLAYFGYLNGDFRDSIEVVVDVDGTPSGTDVPMRYDLYTRPPGGFLTRRMSIRANGDVEVDKALVLPNSGTIEIGDVELSRASAGVLAVDGALTAGRRIQTKTASFTLTESDSGSVIIMENSGFSFIAITESMPNGFNVIIYRKDGFVEISGTGFEFYGPGAVGANAANLNAAYSAVELVSDGSHLYAVSVVGNVSFDEI